jgi:predicted ester cyclase
MRNRIAPPRCRPRETARRPDAPDGADAANAASPTDRRVARLPAGESTVTAESDIPFFLECVRHFSDPAAREKYLKLYDPSIVLHGYGLPPGIDAVRAHYDRLWSAFPDVTLQIDDILESGDRLANRFTISGTHTGEFRGAAPTGRRIEYSGITILRFSGGRCVERWSQTDTLSMLRQLGVTQIT